MKQIRIILAWYCFSGPRAVYADGKLGWVQQIGADPRKVTKSMTEVYGVGAFLLAGSEVYRLAENPQASVNK